MMEHEVTLPMTARQYDYRIESFDDNVYQLAIYDGKMAVFSALTRNVQPDEAGEFIVGTWQRQGAAGDVQIIFHPDNKLEMITADAHRTGFWKKAGPFTGRIIIAGRK